MAQPQDFSGKGVEAANVALFPLHFQQAPSPFQREWPTGGWWVFKRSADAEIFPNNPKFSLFPCKVPLPSVQPSWLTNCQKRSSRVFGAEPTFQECISPSPGWIWMALAASSLWEDLQSLGPRVRLVEAVNPQLCSCAPESPGPAQQRGAAGCTLHGRSPSWHCFSWRPSTSDSPMLGLCVTACESLSLPG